MNRKHAQVALVLSTLLLMHATRAADSNNASAKCASNTESRLLALFNQTVTWMNDTDSEDGPCYILDLTWNPAWGVNAWDSLGCLANVKELMIAGGGLAYSLPDSFSSNGAFPRLEELFIWEFRVNGALPESWAQPEAFPRLRSLDLRSNSLTGVLSEAWTRSASFPELRAIVLQNNSFSGPLPEKWGRRGVFPALEKLDLTYNSFTGTLPRSWGANDTFLQLNALKVWGNKLTGTLPGSWGATGAFPQLSELWLGYNQISGVIPMAWTQNGSFPALSVLNLDRNRLSSTLPPGLASLPALQWLELSFNALSGSIPGAWSAPGSFLQLESLDLSNNLITGSLRGDWAAPGRFSKLRELELSDNQFTGTLSNEWAGNKSFPQLIGIALVNNRLSGVLPEAWGYPGAFPELRSLHLQSNKFSGAMPAAWGSNENSFPQLAELNLSNNNLIGSLPQQWGAHKSFPALQVLDLRTNNLSGPLPESWASDGAFPVLMRLDLSENSFTGTLPSTGFHQLRDLNISKNRFVGGLPKTWGANGGSFEGLWILILHGNCGLGGSIPAEWGEAGRFRLLHVLDASSTGLSGELPTFNNPDLVHLNFKNTGVTLGGEASGFWNSSSPLLLLDLSNTSISGQLPEAFGFMQTLLALNVGNTSLTGGIPFLWLGANQLLSRILLGGQALWEESGRNQTWRREVCVKRDYYQTDEAAKKELVTKIVSANLPHQNEFGTWSYRLQPSDLEWVRNDTYVASLCKNQDAPLVTGCLLSSFLAVVAAMLLVYYITLRKKSNDADPGCCSSLMKCLPEWLKNRPGTVPQWLPAMGSRVLGLFSLATYLVGIATEIQVIVRVWGLWPSYLLLAIFSWHHIYRGLVISFYFIRVSSEGPTAAKRGAELSEQSGGRTNIASPLAMKGEKFHWTLRHIVLALYWSPLVMLLTFVLDIWSFFDAFDVPSLPLLNVESYSDMRIVLLPALQSLYSAAITTSIFLMGNEPKNGIFYSKLLYTQAVVLACVSMLSGLFKLLMLSRASGMHVWITLWLLIRGRWLRPDERTATLDKFFEELLTWMLSFPAVVRSTLDSCWTCVWHLLMNHLSPAVQKKLPEVV